MHPLLSTNIAYVPEDESVAAARYRGFASGFFERLYRAEPSLRGAFVFFRDPRSGDVWSVCDGGQHAFGVQLDPDIEIICIWDSRGSEEIGTWIPDPIEHAIRQIQKRFLAR